MKKRLFIGLLLILCVFVGLFVWYVLGISFRKPVVPETLSAMMPAKPLAYVQCSQLQSHLKQLPQSQHYQDFLQSPLYKHLQSTEWWQEFSYSFNQSLNEMVIDPMRIVGTDVAMGLYPAESGERFPGLIVISHVDQVAKSGERLLYLFELVSGLIGVHVEQEVEGLPVYVIDREDLLLPLYYSIINDLWMVSTSLPLLKNTMLQTLGRVEEGKSSDTGTVEQASPFPQLVETTSDERVMTWYWDPSRFAEEFRQNPFLASLELLDDGLLSELADLPLMTMTLDVASHSPVLRTEIYPKNHKVTTPYMENQHVPKPTENALNEQRENMMTGNMALLGRVHRKNLPALFHALEQIFPQQQWTFPDYEDVQAPEISGKFIECRVSKKLFGTLYTVPDISCLLDTQDAQRALTAIEQQVDASLVQFLPSATQRRMMVMKANESYQDVMISKWHLLLQEVFCYAAYGKKQEQTLQRDYLLLATNTAAIRTRLDELQTHQEASPYIFSIQPEHEKEGITAQYAPIGTLFIHNAHLAELLEAFSTTQTFSLIFPQKRYQALYEEFPDVLRTLKSLPPVFLFELAVKDRGLSLTMQIE